jgi:hypothetical protein
LLRRILLLREVLLQGRRLWRLLLLSREIGYAVWNCAETDERNAVKT